MCLSVDNRRFSSDCDSWSSSDHGIHVDEIVGSTPDMESRVSYANKLYLKIYGIDYNLHEHHKPGGGLRFHWDVACSAKVKTI